MHDPLLELLPGPHDADRPWLNCYGNDERVELTGHVLSMWLAKIAGLITSESTPGDGVHVGLPPHWRTVAWACGAWLAGRTVLSNDLTETGARGGALGDALPARLTRGELVAQVEAVAGGTGEPGTHGPRAALVRRPRTAEALLGVLAAWSTGRTAVVLTPEAGDDVAAAAIRQEGICEAQPD